MARIDKHQLPNLSLSRKVLASLVLLFGLFLFFSAWFISVILTAWETSPGALLELGEMLDIIRQQSARTFYGLLIVHGLSVPLILAITRNLFSRTALTRAIKWVAMAVPVTLCFIDLGLWGLLAYSRAARLLLGPVLLLESLCLLALVLVPLKEMWIYTRWKGAPEKKRVVIVGGGFGGVYTAMGLDKHLGYHSDLEVTLIDKKNYFMFPPLLPGVATGAIESRQVTYPFRRIFEATNVVFRKEYVEHIDFEKRVIRTRVSVGQDSDSHMVLQAVSETKYDYLVLAPGSETNTFNTEGADQNAFFMKELGDAIAVRNHIIDCFELAAREPNPSVQRELLRFVVVGGGPTGVEVASEVVDLIDLILLRRYPEVDRNFVEVYLVQSGPAVLPGWNDHLVSRTTQQLQHLNVKLLMNMKVIKVGGRTVTLSSGELLATRTCVWCSGVKVPPLLDACAIPKHRSGRVQVRADLRSTAFDEVFVLGDAAYLEEGGKPLPMLAQVAVQQGNATAANLSRLMRGKQTQPFKYFNYGSLISVGEHFAVIDLQGLRMAGFVAWFIWRTLYLAKLVGLGNRIRVVIDWTLDLLVERSISQIWTSREEVQMRAGLGGADGVGTVVKEGAVAREPVPKEPSKEEKAREAVPAVS